MRFSIQSLACVALLAAVVANAVAQAPTRPAAGGAMMADKPAMAHGAMMAPAMTMAKQMPKPMIEEGMMMAAKEMKEMAPGAMAPMMAREMMVQAMMHDPAIMTMAKQQMGMTGPDAEKAMMAKVETAMTAMMKDKQAMMGVVKEAMMRRAAMMQGGMMHDEMKMEKKMER